MADGQKKLMADQKLYTDSSISIQTNEGRGAAAVTFADNDNDKDSSQDETVFPLRVETEATADGANTPPKSTDATEGDSRDGESDSGRGDDGDSGRGDASDDARAGDPRRWIRKSAKCWCQQTLCVSGADDCLA